MNHQENSDIYKACESAFATELVHSIRACVAQVESLSEKEKLTLVSSLAFAIAAHLSGSSYGGCVNEDEVYPTLGFSLGEGSNEVYFGAGVTLHESILNLARNESP